MPIDDDDDDDETFAWPLCEIVCHICCEKFTQSPTHTHTYMRRVCRGHTNQINEQAQLEASSNRGEDKGRGRLLTSRVLNMEYACQNTNNKEGESEGKKREEQRMLERERGQTKARASVEEEKSRARSFIK